ncbi:MAG: bifunctional DNA-binding transcriptional regulator/O6-methylguanine-DNA methyltransferase Ada [Nitrospirae bacterium]|nr:MAG: bifunctional DNA-binding transcriptional regulator/O6-methylguanine-DNA methyltransferase Ada [Nitrospirota bacterium]
MPSLKTERAWEAVLERDRRFDGQFVYGVASTKVYCRPSCPSRRPSRNQVTFFDSSRLAETAGFRACRRCRPESAEGPETESRIDQARRYLDEHYDEPVTLQQLAGEIRMSPYYLQRAFKRLVGSSPKEYRDMRRMEHFKISLKRGDTVTNATYEAGFGSSSRVYERANSELGMTPSVFQAGGLGTTISFTTKATVVGRMLVAVTKRGIVTVRLGNSEASLVASLRQDYPMAALRRDAVGLQRYIAGILSCLTANGDASRLPLDLNASAFQRRVWRALQRIPCGSTRSYLEVARAMGQPAAARAVARACATNPIAVAIPCHRVIREDGCLGGYRWGLQRKHRLLALEQKATTGSSD